MKTDWQTKKLDFNIKDKLINLSGTCFWYWNTFYSFLESCGVSSSVYRQFGKEGGKYQLMRSILELLERQERYDIIKNIAGQFYNFTPSEDEIDREKANKLLVDFRKIIGSSLLEDEIDKKEVEKKIETIKIISEQKKVYQEKLLKLKNNFFILCTSNDKQKRGYDIEKLFFDILDLEEFEYKRPYKNESEQIDGHFKYESFDYLVEIKWTNEKNKQEEYSIFDGKITGKAQSTRGLFLSITGFEDSFINKASGNNPRIILMDGEDLVHILEGRTTFFDLMKLKTDHFVRKGNVYIKYRNEK